MKMNAFVEGYGCSLNKSDTEKIRGILNSRGFSISESPAEADLIIINTCAVKEQTESRMLKRIKQLNQILREKQGNASAKLVVFGCLPNVSPEKISRISPEIVQLGPSLEALCNFLNIPGSEFSPSVPALRFNEHISILPIARGCLGECSYCCVRQARGSLKSYSIEELNRAFSKAVAETKEIWITAQDAGCYGKDIAQSLSLLLKKLLENKGDFRIRVGMLNPQHLGEVYDSYIPLFDDRRLYRFFHLPLQSGSDRILGLMKRHYTSEDFLALVSRIRKDLPDAAIATDVIAGFPSESEQDFQKTVAVLKKARPDVVNISRYGDRPNTPAAEMEGKLHGRILKKRSRILSELCKKLSLQNNKKLEGAIQEILVTEKGPKGNFIGRTGSYKPVAISSDLRGKFAKVRITRGFPTYLNCEIIPSAGKPE